jgi:hypothetical protein
MVEKYTILHDQEILYKDLTEEEYFDMMEDLSREYYLKGFPDPTKIETKIIQEH